METKLARIAQIAKERPREQFTSLAHLLDVEMLRKCHKELSGNKAVGIDEVTKAQYEENLAENLEKLHESLKMMTYKPQAVRRVYIPKPGSSKKRPLGIPAYEDKIVQLAVSKILSVIYEQDFTNSSYGFRPGLSAHDALRELNNTIMSRKINWVVDADIAGFFDHVDHRWMMKCLEVRIKDSNLLRIIARMLKGGIMEEGEARASFEGTPQGGVISPILANVYLHYVLDLWFDKVVKKRFQGSAYIIRYSDDFVCCFQHESEARNFYQMLTQRLAKFNLSIAPDKSKIIEFGLFAPRNAKRQGKSKPETFDFLGFTHYCSQSRNGKFRVKRKTSKKKFKAAILRMKQWIRNNRTIPVTKLIENIKPKLTGHYRYYGITDNGAMLSRFRYEVLKLLFKWTNRRSQRNSYTWDNYLLLLKANPLPAPKIYVSIFSSG